MRGPSVYFEAEGGGSGAPPAPAPTPPTPGNMVPQDRFNEVTRQARDAQARADALQKQIDEAADADKTEKERAEATAAREKKRADEAETELARTRRNHALHAAATAAGALSPDAIVALAESRNIEIDPDKPDTIEKAIATMKGTDETPGHDAALFGDGATPARPAPLGLPHTPRPSGADPAEADDPKLALGRGLLGHLSGRG